MTDTEPKSIILYTALAIAAIIIVCIAAAVVASVASIIVLPILIFVVRIKVGIEFKDEFRLWVSFLGIKHTILPKKPKKYKIRDYTPEKIAKRDRKAAELAKRKAEEKAKKRAEKSAKRRKKKAMGNKLTPKEKRAQFREKLAKWPAIDDSADLLVTILETFFTSFFGRFHFHVVKMRIAVGSSDAAKTALLTTIIGGAIEPLLYAIDRHSNLHVSRNADVCVYPDFLAEEIKYDVQLAFSMSIASFLWTVIKTAIPGYIGWTKIQPSAVEDKVVQAVQKSATDQSKTN